MESDIVIFIYLHPMNKHIAYLSMGSNMDNRKRHMDAAIASIKLYCGEVLEVSNTYESDAIGFKTQNRFLNLAMKIKVDCGPLQLLLRLEAIEIKLGRLKPSIFSEYTDRQMDIDIIFFDDLVMNSKELIIPHPRMQDRLFVLKPLAELCPDFIHPVFKKTVRELLAECSDQSKLELSLER